MPALRTRDTQNRSALEVSTEVIVSSTVSSTLSSTLAPQPLTLAPQPLTSQPLTSQPLTLAPPTLAIISPTPRAFSFPISHNLTDSPFSSPSHSPFEPDLRSLALSSTPPPPRSSTTPDSSYSPSSHRRRKSCSTDTPERRPRKGDDDYIKRPENAFILFRRKCCEDRQASHDDAPPDAPTKKQRQADLSKTISQQWKSLPADERQYWENLAKEKKKEHEALYPNYVYRPQRARDRDGRPKPRKPRRRGSDDEPDTDTSLSFVVPVVPPHQRHHARSASAPTPPPYQSIQVPNVYHMTPSCPTSPSLLPMISRRASHPDYADTTPPFDFYPNDACYTHPHLDPSLQSSEFLQSMFTMAGLPPPRDSLRPLDVSSDYIDPMLLPPHHILSPSSSSSGPSSPHIDPQSPHLLPSSVSPPHPTDFDLQMEMQLQQEYAQFSWTTPGSWQSHPDILLADNDFDITAIPPIQLDVTKCVDPMSMSLLGTEIEMEYAAAQAQGQEYVSVPSSSVDPADFSENAIVAFDQMMAAHGF